jgi:small GTP-binding protein
MSTDIRNFCIIAHVDHGKTTLTDRLLQVTQTVAAREFSERLLDSNPIEKERGITIKLAPVRMRWKNTILNLIDTPGHVDFGYEVSRSLAACEGAVLVVDATQGVQAQTLSNFDKAMALGLTIIPVINKVDLPSADVENTMLEMMDVFHIKENDILHVSAKTGLNIEALLDAIIARIPTPTGQTDAPLRALVFTSYYDTHRGVVAYVRVVDGELHTNGSPGTCFIPAGTFPSLTAAIIPAYPRAYSGVANVRNAELHRLPLLLEHFELTKQALRPAVVVPNIRCRCFLLQLSYLLRDSTCLKESPFPGGWPRATPRCCA